MSVSTSLMCMLSEWVLLCMCVHLPIFVWSLWLKIHFSDVLTWTVSGLSIVIWEVKITNKTHSENRQDQHDWIVSVLCVSRACKHSSDSFKCELWWTERRFSFKELEKSKMRMKNYSITIFLLFLRFNFVWHGFILRCI